MARRRNKPDRRKQREKAAVRSGEVVDPSAGRANLSFGERCTGDYLLQRRADLPSEIHDGDGEEFSYGAKAGAVFLDLGTDWKTIEPVQYRSKEETLRAFQVFCGPDDHVRSVYTDNAPELKSAFKAIGIRNPTSTPGVPQTNGIAEATVKYCKQGIRCQLMQSGYHPSFWEHAARSFAFLDNTSKRVRWPGDLRLSPYERRFRTECDAPIYLFGQLVDFMLTPFPMNAPGPFEARVHPGLFA